MKKIFYVLAVLVLAAGLGSAARVNEITTSSGNLILNSSAGFLDVANNVLYSGGVMNMAPSGDTTHGISFTTTGGIPYLAPIGSSGFFIGPVANTKLRLTLSPSPEMYLYDDNAKYFYVTKNNATVSGGSVLLGNGDPNGTLTLFGNNDVTNTVSVGVSTVARLYPMVNNSATLGYAGRLWATLYAKTTVTSDAFYNGNPTMLIREVEKPDGLVREFIPKSLLTSCSNSSNTVQIWNGSTYLTRQEIDTECWARIGEEQWNSLSKITMSYDGGLIYSGELLTNSKGYQKVGNKKGTDVLKSIQNKPDGMIDHDKLDSSLVTDGHISIDKRVGLLESVVKQMAATLCSDGHNEYC